MPESENCRWENWWEDPSIVNVAINVPVDNKKNAFFGVPFEGIIGAHSVRVEL